MATSLWIDILRMKMSGFWAEARDTGLSMGRLSER